MRRRLRKKLRRGELEEVLIPVAFEISVGSEIDECLRRDFASDPGERAREAQKAVDKVRAEYGLEVEIRDPLVEVLRRIVEGG